MDRIGRDKEVFTGAYLVQTMCDRAEPLISDFSKKILDPGCGTGNFLIEIMDRRLNKNPGDQMRALIALSNVYGIDICEDFILEARHRIRELICDKYKDASSNYYFLPLIDLFLEHNLVVGDYVGGQKNIQLARWSVIAPFKFTCKTFTINEILSGA